MTASERRLGRYLRAPEGHGEGGGGGGAAALFDDPPGDDKGGGDDKGAGGEGDDKGAGGGDDKGDPPDLSWAAGISAEKAGDDPSNLDWLKASGVKDLDGLVKVARDNIRAVREGGKVKIPGEGAKPEEIKAFREAMGVPETAEGYEVKLPEVDGGAFKLELDTGFLEPMKAIAHEMHMPAATFKALADKFVEQQLEDMRADMAQADTDREAVVKDWGPKAAAHKMDFRRGAEILGWDKTTIAQLERGGNTRTVMEGLAKIGQLAGEDFFAGEGGSTKFGVGSLEEANAALDAFNAEEGVYAKLKAKDPATVARYDRLTGAVAHFKKLAAKK